MKGLSAGRLLRFRGAAGLVSQGVGALAWRAGLVLAHSCPPGSWLRLRKEAGPGLVFSGWHMSPLAMCVRLRVYDSFQSSFSPHKIFILVVQSPVIAISHPELFIPLHRLTKVCHAALDESETRILAANSIIVSQNMAATSFWAASSLNPAFLDLTFSLLFHCLSQAERLPLNSKQQPSLPAL